MSMEDITRKGARDILDTMLGYLGFMPQIDDDGSYEEGIGLQISGGDMNYLIGRDGRTLEDLQYLVNRFLHIRNPESGKVRLDVLYYRAQKEDEMVQKAIKAAERVKNGGRPVTLPPLNSYDRRLVHNALMDDPEIQTSSPSERARMKKITISLKKD